MKKKLMIVTILLLTLFLTGCKNDITEKDIAQCKKKAQKSAEKYLKEKYNMKATITTVLPHVEDMLLDGSAHLGQSIDFVEMKATYNDKEFNIKTLGCDEVLGDTYQKDKINKKTYDYIKDKLTIKPQGYYTSSGYSKLNIDKTDYEKFLKEEINNIELYYLGDIDFNDLCFDEINSLTEKRIVLMSFKTQETLDEYLKEMSEMSVEGENTISFLKYGDYCYDMYAYKEVRDTESLPLYERLETINHNGILLTYTVTMTNQAEDREIVTIKETNENYTEWVSKISSEDAEKKEEWLSKEVIDSFVTETKTKYDNTRENLYIFIPKEKIRDFNSPSIGILGEENGNHQSLFTSGYSVRDKYYRYNIHLSSGTTPIFIVQDK